VPFIIRWPGRVKPGSVCQQLVHQADLLATLAEILETPLPDNAGEDSFSLVPLLRGEDRSIRETAVSCSIQGVPGVRLGSWKYIPAQGSAGWGKGGDTSQPLQLYDLSVDLGEQRNLAAANPDRLAQLQQVLEKLIANGRSRPGPAQANDVEVIRYPRPPAQRKARAK
jgi:arylsulfatase A-like enzyme